MAITPADHRVYEYLDEVCNLRGLGHQVGLSPGDLNQLDGIADFKKRRAKFILQWHIQWHTKNKGCECNWIALRNALLAPQLVMSCRRLAGKISQNHEISQKAESLPVHKVDPKSGKL